ncbi:MAG TPA: hypothetical protein DCE04_02235 [Thermoanaerobacter sp.]|nr:hypothetical protein [Thermoanaerobacter sp.]
MHVLGTPPAFVLSQDQTLRFISLLFHYIFFRLTVHFSRGTQHYLYYHAAPSLSSPFSSATSQQHVIY